jgi:hypothetical protein
MHDDPIRDDLPPGTRPSEIRELAAVARRLQAERPVPAPRFRGELGRELAGARARHGTESLPRRRALAAAAWCSFAGLALLALAAAGLAGAGPFAPS